MRRGTFAAIIAVGIALPVIGLGIGLSRPSVRAWLGDFFAPMPLPPVAAPAHSVEALPPQLAITGAESGELRGLVAGDAGAPADRGPRTILFPREIPVQHDEYTRPPGLKRPELSSHDDATVDRAIQYLATDARGHGALLAAVKRNGRHHDEVDRIVRAWKVPTEVGSIAFIESALVPTASSLDGGVGFWSLTPDVARAYGLAILPKYDERRSVALSTEAAAHYLSDLHERLGSWELALYAFGQGYARTLDALKKHSSLEYWDIVGELPADGTTYVSEILAVTTMLENPGRFGLDVVRPDDPEVTSDLEVPGDAPFSTIARAAGTSVERLRELNPEYLGDTVPSTSFAMIVHLPSASLARAKELLMPLMYSTSGGGGGGGAGFDWGRRGSWGRDGGDSEGGPPTAPSAAPTTIVPHGSSRRMYYRVQDGDTLESLSRRFDVPRETIASDNALDSSAGLKPGQLLLLRSGGTSATAPSTTP